MRRIFQLLCGLSAAVVVFTSCLRDNDNEATLYSDVAITSFTLGTLNRYHHTTTAAGADSVYRTTVTGSTYLMNIDHLGGRIWNNDSLPTNTDLAHVLCTVVTRNSGLVYVKSVSSDTLTYVSSRDSIDFTTPRLFRVYSSDGLHLRDYTVTLTAKTADEDSIGWTRLADAGELAALTGLKAVSLNGRVVVLGQLDGMQTVIYSTPEGDGNTWQLHGSNLNMVFPATAYCNVAVQGGWLYLFDGSALWRSADAEQWQPVELAGGTALKQLLGAGTRELFALDTDGQLVASTDEGRTWTAETLDDSASLLPDENIGFTTWPYATVASTDYVLMAGTRGDDVVVWRKVSEYGSQARPGQWVYMTPADDNRYLLPQLDGLTLVNHNGVALAMGASSTLYVSRDEGITWKRSSAYTMPDGLTPATAVVDGRNRLWLLGRGDGQVWRGVLE